MSNTKVQVCIVKFWTSIYLEVGWTACCCDTLSHEYPSSSPRIVNVSSELYKQGNLDFDNLDAEKGWDPKARNSLYCVSKLANILHSKELARRLRGEKEVMFVVFSWS